MTLAVIIVISVVLESLYSSSRTKLVNEGFEGDNNENKENEDENKKDTDKNQTDDNLTTKKQISVGENGEPITDIAIKDNFIDLDEIWNDMEKKTDGNVVQNIQFPNDSETEKILGENEDLKKLFKSMTFGNDEGALEKTEKTKVKDKNGLTNEDIQAIIDDNQSDGEENSAELFTIKDDKGRDITPASAQRDVFKMINTMKQLGTSIKAMAPTLIEAKKVMDMLKRFDGEKKKTE